MMALRGNRLASRHRRIPVVAVLTLGFLFLGVQIASAQQQRPLLMPGKRTLFQKVITHPGARLYASAGEASPVLKDPVDSFTVYYVYERTVLDGSEWMEVGLSSTGEVGGWIKILSVNKILLFTIFFAIISVHESLKIMDYFR